MPAAAPRVSAVVLAYNRRDVVGEVLDRLAELPIDEVIVADNGSSDGTAELVRSRSGSGSVRLVEVGANSGIAARNRGVEAATGDLLLMLDDDSHPLPRAIETMLEAFRRVPRLGALGGLLHDVDPGGDPVPHERPGSFDWWLRGGREGEPPPEGFPAIFFPEGASMLRREAFLEVGGWFEPYFFGASELDLATRLISCGWDVRYLPTAEFRHLRRPNPDPDFAPGLRLNIRNQVWYFWRHFPAGSAALRIAGYGLFDLVQCLYRGVPRAWWEGVADAWRLRGRVRGSRRPLAGEVLQRAELRRARLHMLVLGATLRRLGVGRLVSQVARRR